MRVLCSIKGEKMGVRTKGRRKISVDEREYVWYVKEDYDSPYMILMSDKGEQRRSHAKL